MIPQEKIAAATRGLQEAFGVTAFDDIRDLTERPGSNRAFRILVRGSAYLLRINTRPGDMTRHVSCMRAAAKAGLAPRVLYTSAEDRISITDFVEAVPFPAADALRRIPATLRTLHALPPFPIAPLQHHMHIPAEQRARSGRTSREIQVLRLSLPVRARRAFRPL